MKTVKAKHINEFNMNDWAIILRLVRQEMQMCPIIELDKLAVIEDAIINMAFEKANRELLNNIEVNRDAKEI